MSNLKYCMKNRCNGCKNYGICFNYKPKRRKGKRMLVKATNKYKELNLQDKELQRIPEEGEEFEVSNERFKVLTKDNGFKEVFVEKVEEIETAVKDVEKETTKKKIPKKVK